MVQGQSAFAPNLAPGMIATAPTLEQARADFYAVVDSTVDLVGGEWDIRDSATSRGCVVAFGLAGRTYTALRLARGPGAELGAPGTAATDTLATDAPDTTAPDTTAPDTTAPDTAAPDSGAPGVPTLDSSEILRRVTSSWTRAGYTVERSRIGPVIQLIATSDANEQLIFRISERAMTLQGESECRPET